MLKRLSTTAFLLFAGFIIWQHEVIIYGLRQGAGQAKVLWNAKPVDHYLQEKEFPDSLKQKLKLVGEIKKFAFDSLGINPSGSYSTLYDQKGQDILWVVTAAAPFSLEAKEWSFPLLGAFSYKGFFDLSLASRQRNMLKNEGYDASIRTVNAWSTLGWFDDPILSNMLMRREGELANLIIHELTHGTLYVKDSVEFNENLASFIGDLGARKFLAYKYGVDSEKYKDYVLYQKDRKSFTAHFLRGANKLDSLYNRFTSLTENSEKQKLKREMIEKILIDADTLELHDPERFNNSFTEFFPDNTFFMSFLRYRGNMDSLKEQYINEFNGDLQKFLAHLKSKYPSL